MLQKVLDLNTVTRTR